jgi:diguanylate cyclase (GGDEF)-like protein
MGEQDAALADHPKQGFGVGDGSNGTRSLLTPDRERAVMFKPVNHDHGQGTGDHLLSMAAARIRSRLHGIDTAAGFGGDEFVPMMNGIGQPDECEIAARHTTEAFRQPFTHAGIAARIGIGVGIAVAPRHGSDPPQRADVSDRAMCEAKKRGHGRYKMQPPPIELAVSDVPVG